MFQMSNKIVLIINECENHYEIPIICPDCHAANDGKNIIKDGHDTSVKCKPQKYRCKPCERTFYPHTSGFYTNFNELLIEFLAKLFENGRLNFETVRTSLNCSGSSVSRLFKMIMDAISNSILTKIAWNLPVSGKIIIIDETWIKIGSKNWYIVVIVDEEHHVLAWDLIKRRDADTIQRIASQAIQRLQEKPPVIVTDDFSVYKDIVKRLGYDLIHIRHIHKPPYGRIVIDHIKNTKKEINITHIATTNDIFCNTNTFLTRISNTKIQKREKGIRGRKKGSKNFANTKNAKINKNKKSIQKKRGPKNPFTEGKTRIFHYNKSDGSIKPFGNSDNDIASFLQVCREYFSGKYITTNYIEQQFASLKYMINFRGKRSELAWKRIILFYFTVREFPGIIEGILSGVKLCPYIINRAPDLVVKLLSINKKVSVGGAPFD